MADACAISVTLQLSAVISIDRHHHDRDQVPCSVPRYTKVFHGKPLLWMVMSR